MRVISQGREQLFDLIDGLTKCRLHAEAFEGLQSAAERPYKTANLMLQDQQRQNRGCRPREIFDVGGKKREPVHVRCCPGLLMGLHRIGFAVNRGQIGFFYLVFLARPGLAVMLKPHKPQYGKGGEVTAKSCALRPR